MRDIDGRTLEEIIHYIYVGYISLTPDSIDSIFPAATRMRISELREKCIDFLMGNLAAENCLQYLLLVDRCNEHGQLRNNALSLVCEHFGNILNTVEFIQIQGNSFIEILTHDDLDVPEIDIFNFLFRWFERNEDGRREFVPQLLRLIRLPQLSYQVEC